jgi:uncharacterized protein (TIGR00369 family)
MKGDVDSDRRVRESFERQRFMDLIGAKLAEVGEGRVEIELPADERLTQQHGFLHAAVVAAAVDSACGYAALTLMPAETAVLTVEYKINLLAPAAGERLIARGRVVRAGRTLTTCAGDAFMVVDGAERQIATVTATMMCVRERGLED